MAAKNTPTPLAWEANAELREAWRKELAERVRQVRAGGVESLALENVIAELKKPRRPSGS